MAHMERERILIISHSYSPLLNPRAFRWSAIAEKWAEQGLKVDVITSWLPGLKRFEILNGVEIHRVGGGITERLRFVLRPVSRSTTGTRSKNSGESQGGILKSVSGWILTIARFINDKIWKNIYWPDYACLWIGPASSKALELCEMEKYSSVISVSDPFSSHLAGKSVKATFSDINWLVDIGDPFSFREDCPGNNLRLYRRLNYRLESQIFRLADSISVTTDSTRRIFAELHYGSAAKIKVIPPLMSVTGQTLFDESVLSKNQKIKLVYVGTLYRAIRNPEPLLKLFEKVVSLPGHENIELHFFGGYDDCRDIFEQYHYLIGEKIFTHGLVRRGLVLQAMHEADILVNIGNNNSYQLPSKIVEYVAMAKPIVNLHTIENDSSKEFLADYPAVLNLFMQPNNSILKQANELVGFLKPGQIQIDDVVKSDWREKYGIEKICGAYSRLLTTQSAKSEAIIENQ